MNDKKSRLLFGLAFIGVLALIAVAYVVGLRCGKKGGQEVAYFRDTVVVPEIVSDTVLRWRDKIVWREAQPDTIYVSVDTLDVDTVWGYWPEGIYTLDKTGEDLFFMSMYPADSTMRLALVKQYRFRVGEDFAIRARGDGFYVKTTRGFWSKFYGGLAAGSDFKVWGDSTAAWLEPYVRAYIGWGPVNIGPRIDLHSVSVRIEAAWRF